MSKNELRYDKIDRDCVAVWPAYAKKVKRVFAGRVSKISKGFFPIVTYNFYERLHNGFSIVSRVITTMRLWCAQTARKIDSMNFIQISRNRFTLTNYIFARKTIIYIRSKLFNQKQWLTSVTLSFFNDCEFFFFLI